MQVEKLRSLIRESIQEYIKEIDGAAEDAANEARISKCEEAIQTREAKLNAISESDHKDLMDEGKIKGLENEIKELKKAKAKFEKVKEKKANKKAGKDKKEVTTDAKMEDTPVDESDVMEKMEMEGDMSNEEALNESFLKMQKLAGVITEAQYNQKKKALVEAEDEEKKVTELFGFGKKTAFEHLKKSKDIVMFIIDDRSGDRGETYSKEERYDMKSFGEATEQAAKSSQYADRAKFKWESDEKTFNIEIGLGDDISQIERACEEACKKQYKEEKFK
jgi:hypothetical protein